MWVHMGSYGPSVTRTQARNRSSWLCTHSASASCRVSNWVSALPPYYFKLLLSFCCVDTTTCRRLAAKEKEAAGKLREAEAKLKELEEKGGHCGSMGLWRASAAQSSAHVHGVVAPSSV
jgi:hypothetical protein